MVLCVVRSLILPENSDQNYFLHSAFDPPECASSCSVGTWADNSSGVGICTSCGDNVVSCDSNGNALVWLVFSLLLIGTQ